MLPCNLTSLPELIIVVASGEMAKIAALAGRFSFTINAPAPVRLVKALPVRSYSLYPTNYIKPIFKKSDQEALKQAGQDEALAHVPILPASSSDTSSEFHDEVVRKFTNFIMRKGKKKVAREQLNGAFENMKRAQLKRYHKASPELRDGIILDPVEILYKAVENVTPVLELVKMKRGGVTYQVPVPILEKRQRFLAMNWLIHAAKTKEMTTPFMVALGRELIDAAHNQGRVVKKKQDIHKLAEANRAYAHYRWG